VCFIDSWRDALTSRALSLVSLLAVAVWTGCGGGGPSAVRPPSISAGGAADKAMELYDTDGDGFIAGGELEKVPALKVSMSTLDSNGDGKVEEAEIADRVTSWQGSNVGITSITCTVLMDGTPLRGAVVTFDPVEFLSDALQPAMGTSDDLGSFNPKIPKEKRPTPETPPGLQLGLYNVRVSKKVGGEEKIPTKYNTETVLGQQVAPDDPAIQAHKIIFRLEK